MSGGGHERTKHKFLYRLFLDQSKNQDSHISSPSYKHPAVFTKVPVNKYMAVRALGHFE